VEVGLSLLPHASILLKYWDEAFLAATYLINHLSTKTHDFSSSLERLFDEKPNYNTGLICDPSIATNSNSVLSSVCSSDIATCIRVLSPWMSLVVDSIYHGM
jgi:hypothetical protein